MKSQNSLWTGLIGAIGMIVLILDAKTALSGALDGISLCLNTVIPSLFPFFVFSILLNSTLTGTQLNALHPVGKLLGIPAGMESLLLLGFMGGYPVGAQCITEAYKNERITQTDAHRLLGFCSNAGPAFIFGMGSCLFEQKWILWILWGIHILSALVIGFILPQKGHRFCSLPQSDRLTISQALEKGIRTIASVCGWIILFRVFLAFLQRWFLWLTANEVQVFLVGLMELSNGCCRLIEITSSGTRFVMFAGILGFGGACVAMQTASVTNGLGTGLYFPGKIMQGSISVLISYFLQAILFQPSHRCSAWPLYFSITATVGFLWILLISKKKRVAISC